MAPLLFVTPFPLRASRKLTKTCIRRPRTFACSSTPDEQDREIGEPTWMNLARDLSPKDADDAPRPPPKWEYPEGSPAISENNQQNPWKRWNAAINNEAPLEKRDVKAETDFWRSAARELTDEDGDDSSNKKTGQTISTPQDDILTDEPSKSEDVWRIARGVTGEMTELQEKLRSELERYNPDEKVDQYRDIARELVGPKEEPWENSDPKPTSQTEAEAGSGWNPDVDWMRFDDIRREQAREAEKAARIEAQRVAREQMEMFSSDSQEDFVDDDADAQDGFTDIDAELTRTFTDQSVHESFIQETPMEKLPGFLTNRMRRSGTYGGGWSGAEEEARKLQEQGVPLRDPQADTQKWRSFAREVNLEREAGTKEAIRKDDVQEGTTAEVEPNVEGKLEDTAKGLEEVTLRKDGTKEVEASPSVDEESSWSAWRSGSANWEAANEKTEARDPAKEVDMWRTSARDLISSPPVSERSTPPVQSEVNGADTNPKNEGSAWDEWRSANARWQSSISAASESKPATENTWRSSDRSDWGAGMGAKTMSERSAWEQWNNVSGMDANLGSSLWWNTRTDSSMGRESKPDRSLNNADEWRSIARETLNLPEKQEHGDTPTASKDERIEKDTTLNSWRSIAKDLIEEHD